MVASSTLLPLREQPPLRMISHSCCHGKIRESDHGRKALTYVVSRANAVPHTTGVSCRVITDIDDTVKSSGGVAIPLGGFSIPLGGVDTSFQRNSFYPGVFQFDLEIACHATRVGGKPEKVAVLTARAEEFRFALEIKQSSKLCIGFRKAGESRSLSDWGVGPVLYGSVQEWICQERKVRCSCCDAYFMPRLLLLPALSFPLGRSY